MLQFYRAIREAVGNAILIGCNTVGHLGAGIFELQRIGDDTSGRDWNRTRKMGVNTLGFRLPQHRAFFLADPDCVPFTKDVPLGMTRQWLDLVTKSGTPLFISADPSTVSAEEKQMLKTALAAAARVQPEGRSHSTGWKRCLQSAGVWEVRSRTSTGLARKEQIRFPTELPNHLAGLRSLVPSSLQSAREAATHGLGILFKHDFNRDRGSDRPLTPPTPPYVRSAYTAVP